MSSMFIVFQVPVESGVHPIVQAEPGLKTSPGPGDEGVGSAKTTNAMDKTKVGKATRKNIGIEAKENNELGAK